MAGIFLSYRRDDSGAVTHHIAQYLMRRFGKNAVFFDLTGLSAGEIFPRELAEGLKRSEVVVVIIGPRWASITNEQGIRRIFLPDDFVRYEAGTALASAKAVVPVLVQGATLPSLVELPPDLYTLVKAQPVILRHEEPADLKSLTTAVYRAVLLYRVNHSPRLAYLYPFCSGVASILLLPFILFNQAEIESTAGIIATLTYAIAIVSALIICFRDRQWGWLIFFIFWLACSYSFFFLGLPTIDNVMIGEVTALPFLLFAVAGPRLTAWWTLKRLKRSV